MLRQDKKFTIEELTKLGRDIQNRIEWLEKINKDYFIEDYSRILDSLSEMIQEVREQIGEQMLFSNTKEGNCNE